MLSRPFLLENAHLKNLRRSQDSINVRTVQVKVTSCEYQQRYGLKIVSKRSRYFQHRMYSTLKHINTNETPQWQSCHTTKFTKARRESARARTNHPSSLATVTLDCLQSWRRHVSKLLYVVVGADHPTTPAAMLTAKTDLLSFQHDWTAASQPTIMKCTCSPSAIWLSLYMTQHAPQRKAKNSALLSDFHLRLIKS